MKPIEISEKSKALALEWIVSENTGVSSKTIWSMMMTGKPPRYNSTPSDNSDFGRCYELLKLIPEFEANLERMGEIKNETTVNFGPKSGGWTETDTWAVFVKEYKKLCKLYEKEKNGREFYDYWKNAIKDNTN